MNALDRIARFKEEDWVKRGIQCVPYWISANDVTVFRGLLMIPAALLVIFQLYWWALGVFLFAMLLDFADGALAEARGSQSELGAHLDPLMDKVSVLILLGALAPLVPAGLMLWVSIAVVALALTLTRLQKWRDQRKTEGMASSADVRAKPVGKFKLILEVVSLSVMLVGVASGSAATITMGSLLMFVALIFACLSLNSHLAGKV